MKKEEFENCKESMKLYSVNGITNSLVLWISVILFIIGILIVLFDIN